MIPKMPNPYPTLAFAIFSLLFAVSVAVMAYTKANTPPAVDPELEEWRGIVHRLDSINASFDTAAMMIGAINNNMDSIQLRFRTINHQLDSLYQMPIDTKELWYTVPQ